MKLPRHDAKASNPAVDHATAPRVSVYKPLARTDQMKKSDPLKSMNTLRPMPQWMSLLPSSRKHMARPPCHSTLCRRKSFSFFSSAHDSTPFYTPLEWPATYDKSNNPLIPSSRLSIARTTNSPQTIGPERSPGSLSHLTAAPSNANDNLPKALHNELATQLQQTPHPASTWLNVGSRFPEVKQVISQRVMLPRRHPHLIRRL